ncbi:COPII coat Sec23p-Sfb3p heterodimer component [Tulasnella sp. 424]|nr:COPII coat Sec23p-Sfb3p heterodimer component [Tulasnella sp. 424]
MATSRPPAAQGISQPPHSAGKRFKGLRSVLDPSQIPSAAGHNWADQRRWQNRPYNTTTDVEIEIPLAGTDCVYVDQVAPEYFSPIDFNGRRMDHASRPELNFGTVDFAATSKYNAPQPLPRLLPSFVPTPDSTSRRTSLSSPPELRDPTPLRTLFVIDVSSSAIHRGLLPAFCESIRVGLYGGSPNEVNTSMFGGEVNPSMKVGFMTFNESLQFYELSPDQTQPGMLVVPDVDEVFVPTLDRIFVDPQECREAIETLLAAIPRMFAHVVSTGSALCASLQGALASLSRTGGQVLAFTASHPNFGPGMLTPRTEGELYGTQQEHKLWEPQEVVWKDLAEESAESGVGVNLWVFPDRWADLGSIGSICNTTGGDLHFHPRFQPDRDAHLVQSEIARTLRRTTAYNCSVRTRCSNGLHVSSYVSLLHQPTADTLTVGTISADLAIGAKLEHVGSGINDDQRKNVHIQAAVLYTSVEGQRRVRVCNVGVRPSTMAGNVFRWADQDTGVCLMAKEAALAMSRKMLTEIREDLSQRFVDLLVGYRKNCAASTAPSQLILPESYKLLPVFGGAILKTQALKGGPVSSDTRAISRHRILSSGASSLMAYLYPRAVAVHDLRPTTAFPDPTTGRLSLPAPMPNSYLWMEPDGAYLMDNGFVTILWLGSSVSPQILLDLFGTDGSSTLGPGISRLPVFETQLSVQVRNLITHEETCRGGRVVPFLVARQNMDAAELEFGNMLVEDENNDMMSYVDFNESHLQTCVTCTVR